MQLLISEKDLRTKENLVQFQDEVLLKVAGFEEDYGGPTTLTTLVEIIFLLKRSHRVFTVMVFSETRIIGSWHLCTLSWLPLFPCAIEDRIIGPGTMY